MPDINWKAGNIGRRSWSEGKESWVVRIICEGGIGEVLTSLGRQRKVGKREAGLISVENIEEVGRASIHLNLFLYMMQECRQVLLHK